MVNIYPHLFVLKTIVKIQYDVSTPSVSLWVKSNFIAPTVSNLFWDSLLTRRSQNKISNVFSSDFYARCSFSTDLRLDEVPL